MKGPRLETTEPFTRRLRGSGPPPRSINATLRVLTTVTNNRRGAVCTYDCAGCAPFSPRQFLCRHGIGTPLNHARRDIDPDRRLRLNSAPASCSIRRYCQYPSPRWRSCQHRSTTHNHMRSPQIVVGRQANQRCHIAVVKAFVSASINFSMSSVAHLDSHEVTVCALRPR
jgi:hypothetical protein